jgi:hypothetical protein
VHHIFALRLPVKGAGGTINGCSVHKPQGVDVMSETGRAAGRTFSEEFKILLGQYNRQTDYARGISERMIGTLFVFLGFYYGHLRTLPDVGLHNVYLAATVIGSGLVVAFYIILCRKNSERCWGTYRAMKRVSRTEMIGFDDVGIIADEPRYSVWAWCVGFMLVYGIFVLVELVHFLSLLSCAD